MKLLNNILLISCLLFALSGCMDELDKDPIGLLTQEQVDTVLTRETLESAVQYSYQPLCNTLNAVLSGWPWDKGAVFRNDIILQDIASNDINKKWSADGDQAWMDELSDFSFTSENQAFLGIWIYDYEGINRVNLAISCLAEKDVSSTGISDTEKNQMLGELYFLRAFYYFDLVNNFGDVPLIIAPLTSYEEAQNAPIREKASVVWEQISKDLTAAHAVIAEGKYPLSDEKWRVSEGAIIAMQAKVALYNSEWQKVIDYIAELDALGYYSLNSNYFDSFDADKEFTEDENIFVYDHRSNETPTNDNGLKSVAGWGFFAPTDDFVAAFETNDPRLEYTVDIDNKMPRKIIGSLSDRIDYGNHIYIRYADVLLWKAEALNESGDSPGAVAIINQIRARVRDGVTVDGSAVPTGTLPDRSTTADKAQVTEWIQSERRVELGFESHRFNDLKRWGIAKEVLTDLGKTFKDCHYLYPIPQIDIDRSKGSLTQNDGY